MSWLPWTAAAAETTAGLVAKKAALLTDLHQRISFSLVTVAQDQAYKDYFREQDAARREELLKRIDQISLNAQSRFKVDEMCLIGADGGEISRIVDSVVAYDLSPDETGAVFFAPGFAQPDRGVYVSPPYLSPDTEFWVVGYATPILVDGEMQAILHFEHRIDVFRELLAKQAPAEGFQLLAVTDSGWVIYDSMREIAVGKSGDSISPADYFQQFDIGGLDLAALTSRFGGAEAGQGEMTVAGSRVSIAYRKVGGWTLVVLQEQAGS
ncbi:MAG: cache domain-containing protein [Dongiaceae bacterium]